MTVGLFCKRCNLSFIRRALRSARLCGYITTAARTTAKVMDPKTKHSHNEKKIQYNKWGISILLENVLLKADVHTRKLSPIIKYIKINRTLIVIY